MAGIQITHNGTTIKAVSHDDVEYAPDDRQSIVQIIGGVTVEDYGCIDDGEVVSCECVFSASDWATISDYWKNRTRVTVTLPDSSTISNARLVVKRIQYAEKVFPQYKKVQLEIWRI